MEELEFEDVMRKLKRGDLTPYNFYNIDIGYDQVFSVDYYLKNKHDNIDNPQQLNKFFLDIEVFTKHAGEFPEVEQAKYPVSAITFYFSSKQKYYSFLLPPSNFTMKADEIRKYFIEESRKPIEIGKDDNGKIIYDTYLKDDQDVEVVLFNDPYKLVETMWDMVKKEDPAVLSSFNGDQFDYPYLYHYMLNRYGGDEYRTAKLMSKFGEVKLENSRDRAGNTIRLLRIIEYPIVDLLYAYKPRDDGGLNLGKKQQSYSLQNIAKEELGLAKLEYKKEGYTLDQFYEKDPLNYFLYNLWDTCLNVKLDEKTGMIDLYNMQRRAMRTSLSAALRGASPLFDTFVYSDLKEKNQFVRWGINYESSFSLDENDVSKIQKPKSSTKIKWDVNKIDEREVSAMMNKFPGAYVKDPKPGIVTSGTVCDLDASRLYPSMINQYNIGIETFFGRILPQTLNKTIMSLSKLLGSDIKTTPSNFQSAYMDMINIYIDKLGPQNKNTAVQRTYYMVIYLLDKLIESGFTLEELFQPTSIKQYIVSKVYLNNFLELIEAAHRDEKEYNDIAYQWIINGKNLDGEKIFIVENYNNPSFQIRQIDGSKFKQYLDHHKIGVTIAGTLFKTHETSISLFYKFLDDNYKLRKKFQKEMFKYSENSREYKEFNRKQLTTKVLMNTTYGLLGMSSFRYSNKWLAKSITTSGRLALKTAQYYADKYLSAVYGQSTS